MCPERQKQKLEKTQIDVSMVEQGYDFGEAFVVSKVNLEVKDLRL